MSRWTVASPWVQPAEVLDPPLIPSAYDDEFDSGSTLKAAWTRTGVFDDATALDPYASFSGVTGCRWDHNQTRPSWYLMQPSGNSAVPNIYQAVTLPTDCFIWTRLSFNFRNSTAPVTDAQLGFGLYTSAPGFTDGVVIEMNDAGSANAITLNFGKITAGVFASTQTTLTDGAVNAQGCQAFHVIGIQKRGTTYDGWAMTTSGSWQWLGTLTHASTFITQPFYFSNSITTAPGNMVLGIDFVRMLEGKGLP